MGVCDALHGEDAVDDRPEPGVLERVTESIEERSDDLGLPLGAEGTQSRSEDSDPFGQQSPQIEFTGGATDEADHDEAALGHPRRRWIEPAALEEIGAIEARRLDLDADGAGFELRGGMVLDSELILTPV